MSTVFGGDILSISPRFAVDVTLHHCGTQIIRLLTPIAERRIGIAVARVLALPAWYTDATKRQSH